MWSIQVISQQNFTQDLCYSDLAASMLLHCEHPRAVGSLVKLANGRVTETRPGAAAKHVAKRAICRSASRLVGFSNIDRDSRKGLVDAKAAIPTSLIAPARGGSVVGTRACACRPAIQGAICHLGPTCRITSS